MNDEAEKEGHHLLHALHLVKVHIWQYVAPKSIHFVKQVSIFACMKWLSLYTYQDLCLALIFVFQKLLLALKLYGSRQLVPFAKDLFSHHALQLDGSSPLE